MKAILIDPHLRIVSTVEIPDAEGSNHLSAIYAAMDCDLITVAGYYQSHAILHVVYADDEGWFKDRIALTYWPEVYPTPLVGKLLVIGSTDDGGDKSATATPEEIEPQLTWMSLADAREWSKRNPQY